MIYAIIAVAALLGFLLSGGRYRWFYVLYKTLPRDVKAVTRFINLNALLWYWNKRQMTVPKIFAKIVKEHPNKVAFYIDDEKWTYKQIDELSNKIGTYYKNEGVKLGDTVAILMDNRVEYVCLWVGLVKIGALAALINTNLTKDPLIHSISIARCKRVIFGSQYAEAIAEVADKLGPMEYYQYEENPRAPKALLVKAVDLRRELEKTKAECLEKIFMKAKTRDKILYIYTSGTTGLPKAAVITHMRFFFMTMGIRSMALLRSDDVVYDPLPLYHSAGGMVGVGQSILCGSTVALRKKFSASNFWKDCVKYNCTVAQYIGEICRYLLAVPQNEPVAHNVKIMFGNGLRPQIWDQFRGRFKIDKIFEFYGATEGNSNLVNIDNTRGAVGFVPRYAGNLYPVTLIKCDQSSGIPQRNNSGYCVRCKYGEAGVLIGKIDAKKAVLQFSGYADKKATEKKVLEDVFRKGDMYFNSGDILVQDELGYYYFKDRTGDTFRWKGENVATSEVEAVISNCVNLSDAVVYGVEIPNTDGRAGMAAIVDTDNVVNPSELAKTLKANLPAYAIPIFLRVMKSVPITGTFKLKKVDLQTEGFDVNKLQDELFVFDSKNVSYTKLTKELHSDILSGKMRI